MKVVRKTKAVRAVLHLFEEKNGAMSVVELIEHFKGEMNRTTVYRIMERLEREGILHSFNGQGGLRWYAKNKEHISENQLDVHPHFHCRKCGKVECSSIEIEIPSTHKHHIDTIEILLVGECEACHS